jgi:hypothetical protein
MTRTEYVASRPIRHIDAERRNKLPKADAEVMSVKYQLTTSNVYSDPRCAQHGEAKGMINTRTQHHDKKVLT